MTNTIIVGATTDYHGWYTINVPVGDSRMSICVSPLDVIIFHVFLKRVGTKITLEKNAGWSSNRDCLVGRVAGDPRRVFELPIGGLNYRGAQTTSTSYTRVYLHDDVWDQHFAYTPSENAEWVQGVLRDPPRGIAPSLPGCPALVRTFNNKYVRALDSVLLTDGEFAKEWAHSSYANGHGTRAWIAGEEIPPGYVEDYAGSIFPEDTVVELTLGDYEGELAYKHDVESCDDDYWLSDDDVSDVYVYSENYGGWIDRDRAIWCERDGEWYHEDWPPTGSGEGYINDYHDSPSPEFYQNRWGIGFEVEKTDAYGADSIGDEVPIQPLFAGWETDSSCGVEGITHVYDLENSTRFESDLAASDLVDANSSAACGGHVTVSGPGLNLTSIRKFAGVFFALYRNRLNNSYSSSNKDLAEDSRDHYSAIRYRRNEVYEFRLVARVRNGGQLLFRYKLFAILARAIDNDWTFNEFTDTAHALVAEQIGEDAADNVRTLSHHFHDYLSHGNVHPDIQRYV